jgi:hypothetical protein
MARCVAFGHSPVTVGPGEDVVKAGEYETSVLIERGSAFKLISTPMEVVETSGDLHALRIPPRTLANPIAGIDGTVSRVGVGAQVRAPLFRGTDCRGKLLTMSICSGEAAKIAAITNRNARDEEAHVATRAAADE